MSAHQGYTITDRFTTGGIDDVVGQEKNGTLRWLLTDGRGSVTGTTSSGGSSTGSKTYGTFGGTQSQAGTTDSFFAYTGREWDDAAGLQYSRNRWYDPSAKRWLSEDPIGFGGGDANLSRYVGNSPGSNSDPSGLVGTPLNPDGGVGTNDLGASSGDDRGMNYEDEFELWLSVLPGGDDARNFVRENGGWVVFSSAFWWSNSRYGTDANGKEVPVANIATSWNNPEDAAKTFIDEITNGYTACWFRDWKQTKGRGDTAYDVDGIRQQQQADFAEFGKSASVLVRNYLSLLSFTPGGGIVLAVNDIMENPKDFINLLRLMHLKGFLRAKDFQFITEGGKATYKFTRDELVKILKDEAASTPLTKDEWKKMRDDRRKLLAPAMAGLSNEAKDALRAAAREIWQAKTGRKAVWDGLDVHHRIPLEWSHLFPNSDPNRISNLIGMTPANHTQVTNAWKAWRQSLNGRIPTQAEVIQQAMRIDELFGNVMRHLP